jgi:hypothetical protein
MSELGVVGGEEVRGGRPDWVGRLRRRFLLLLAVTALCCVAYLAGVWSAMNTHITCNVSGHATIVCGDTSDPAPAPPARRPPQATGSA